MDPIRFEVQRPTPPRDTGDYPHDSNVASPPAEAGGWAPFMGDNLETGSGSTYGDFIIQVEESPFGVSPDSSLFSGGMYVRRNSDNTSERPPMANIRRSVSHLDIPQIQTNRNFFSYNYVDNVGWSPETTYSSPGVPSPSAAHEMKMFSDGYSDWDGSQIQTIQTIGTDFLATPTSPDPKLLSPLSDSSTGSHLDLSPERGRGLPRSPSRSRHSPYTRSRSFSRVTAQLGHLSITDTSPSSPNPPYQYFDPNNLLDHDPTLPPLNSFEDVINEPGPPDAYAPEMPPSPYSENAFTLLREYPPEEQHISPLESHTGFRPKVGSDAIERAASGRRKRPGDFKCDISGCSATFTAKHNLQNHINSHMGIRKYKCNSCLRDFGTSHVLSRHTKKCTGKRKRVAGSS